MGNIRNSRETKARQKWIKSKAYGLVSGVALVGTVGIFGASPVAHADEVTGSTDATVGATNLSEAPTPSSENTTAVANADTNTPAVTVPVESEALNTAIEEAKSSGVEVTTGEVETETNFVNAQNNLNSQLAEVKDATATQKEVDAKITSEVEKAKESGVVLVKDETVKYTDTTEAKIDVNNQVSNLGESKSVADDTTLITAEATAKSAGVEVSSTTQTATIEEARKIIEASAEKLGEFTIAQSTINQTIASMVAEAEKLGVEIKDGRLFKYTTIEEGKQKLETIVSAIEFAKAQLGFESIINDIVSTGANGSVTVTPVEPNKSFTTISDAQAYENAQLEAVKTRVQELADANKKLSDAKTKLESLQGITVNTGDLVTVPVSDVATKSSELLNELNTISMTVVSTVSGRESTATKDVTLQEYQTMLDRLNAIKARNKQTQDNFNDTYNSLGTTLPNDGSGYTPSGSLTHLKSSPIKGYIAVSSGDTLNPPTVMIVREDGTPVDKSKVITRIAWENTPLELASGNPANAPMQLDALGRGGRPAGGYTDIWEGGYDYGQSSRIYEIIADGQTWYKIAGAATMADGTKKDVFLSAHKDPAGLNSLYQNSQAAIWNDGKAINLLDGGSLGMARKPGDAIRLTISLDSPNNTSTEYVWTSVYNDLDGGQYFQGNNADFRVLAVGGGLSVNSVNPEGIASHENLGFTYGKNRTDMNALDGVNSLPDGGALLISVAPIYSTIVRNTWDGNGSGVARADFGEAGVATLTLQEQEFKLSGETTYHAMSSTMGVTPAEVNPEVAVDSVTLQTTYVKPTVTTSYHDIRLQVGVNPVKVDQTPDNYKSVTNEDGVDINSTVIPKGSTVIWTLQDSPLVSGRDLVESYVRTDALPDGFEINLSDTVKSSRGFTISYDSATRTITSRAISGTINQMNADVTQQFTPPVVNLVGIVTKDNLVYKNVFTTTIVFKDVKIVDGEPVETTTKSSYETTSNLVKVTTPSTPDVSKENKNLDGVNIDGTVLPIGSTNVYELNWNLSNYKGIEADSYTIAKGFAFVDDYPEKAVDILTDGIRMVDSTGKVVTGVSVKRFDSIEQADQATKDFLSKAGITPDGAFQIFVADNSVDFYNKYVKQGISIKITDPMKIKDSLYGVDTIYTNKPYQIDFGNGYGGELVTNKVVTPDPEKENQNLDGVVINGKQLAVGMTNNYKLLWDLSKYKGTKPTASQISQGFYLVDDYPEEAVRIVTEDIRLVDSLGRPVTGVSVKTYNSVSELPASLKAMLESQKISPKGTFQVFSADNPVDFYNKYVVTGLDIVVTDPMVVRDELKGKNVSYENTVYQADFGNAYIGDTVENNVVSTDPTKQDLNTEGVDINGTPVAVGMVNVFKLKWDLDQFKGMLASNSEIAKGFFYIDDYPEDAVNILTSRTKMTDTDGKAVTGVSVKTYANVSEAPELVRSALTKWGVKPTGAFQVFSADNAMDFYTRYVQTGRSIIIENPMMVKDELKDTGGSYKNTAYQLEFGNVNATETVGNEVPKVEPVKENLNGEGVNINGTIREIGMVNYYTLKWDLDQYKGVKATAQDVAKGFYMVDDYPEEAVSIVNDGVKVVVESTGELAKGVSVTVYNSLAEAPTNVKNALTKWGISPNGAFQVFSADNPTEFYNQYVAKGINLKVVTPMMVREDRKGDTFEYVNTAYQLNFGNAHETETVVNNVTPPTPKKDNYNLDNVLINGTPTVLGMTNNYKMTWDLDQYRGIVATADELADGFFFVDDFPEEVVTINSALVTLTDSDGNEVTGVSVRQYSNISDAPSELQKTLAKWGISPKGAFQVISADNPSEFYAKYVTTGKNISIVDPMVVRKDIANVNHEYSNTAYQVGFNTVYSTKTVENTTPSVDPHKENLNTEGVDINGTPMYVGAINNYTLDWDLNQFKGIKADSSLIAKGFFYVDDYPEEAVTIKASDVRVLTVDGHDVTDRVEVKQYNSLSEIPKELADALAERNIVPKGAFQVISAKDVNAFYSEFVQKGISLKVVDPMVVKPEMKDSNKSYFNTAYQVNFGTAYTTETVDNFVPSVDPTKDNFNLDGVNINNNVLAVGMTNVYTLKWDLDQFRGIKAVATDVAKGFMYIDDFQEDSVTVDSKGVVIKDSNGAIVDGVTVSYFASVDQAPSSLRDLLKAQGYEIKGAFQLFTADNPQDFYVKYVQTGQNLYITTPMVVKQELKDSGGVYENTGYQIGFGIVDETPTVINRVPKVEPTKANKNTDGEDINNTSRVVGMTNQYELTWKNSQYKGMEADKESIAKGFFFVDDFDESVLDVVEGDAYVKDAIGTIIKGISVKVYNSFNDVPSAIRESITRAGYNFSGAVQVFTADNPTDFYNKYVKTGQDLTIVTPMTIKESLKANGVDEVYTNVGYQINFGNSHITNVVVNNVPEVDPVKENLNADGVDINGTPVAIGFVNHFKLTWSMEQYKGIKPTNDEVLKGFYFIDDFPEEAVDIVEDDIRLTDSNGEEVTGVSHVIYESVEDAPKELQEFLKAQNISPKGAFQVFSADNPTEFFAKYVKQGINIFINDPMLVKDELRGEDASYTNTAYQIDFGIGYITETTENHVPKVTPVKENFNSEGVNIDGKEVLPNSINYYKLTWDLDQYKGIKADKETIAKGFFYVDDYPEEAVNILTDSIRFFTESVDDEGNKVQTPVEGISVKVYESIEDAPENIQIALKELGYEVKGAFQLFTADNPTEFYENYVAKGINIYIVDPMQVKSEMASVGGKYENQAIQIDFGKAHLADLVVNNIPKLEVIKKVTLDGKDVNNGTIPLHSKFSYEFVGSYIPANRSDALWEYKFVDDYQESHDKFLGEYKATARVDFVLRFKDADGNVVKEVQIKAGDEITKYTKLIHDEKNGIVTIDMTDEFFDALDLDQPFISNFELFFERIASGEVKNTVEHYVNGAKVYSNTVVTTTPEPEKPSAPTIPQLPNTGEGSASTLTLVGIFLSFLSIFSLMFKKKED